MALRVCFYAYSVARNGANCHSGNEITSSVTLELQRFKCCLWRWLVAANGTDNTHVSAPPGILETSGDPPGRW